MGASAAASAAFGGGGGGATQSQNLAQHMARMEAMRRRGGLSMGSIISDMIAAAQRPQIGTASSINNQDPNNLSSTGFGGVVTQNNNMMNPGEAQLATGAPEEDYGQGYRTNWKGGFAGPTGGGVLTAGMAVGDAPIATAGNFNPQTEFAAARMFGNGTQFAKPKKLINL